MMQLLRLCSLPALALLVASGRASASPLSLPDPTGPFNVGVARHVVQHLTPNDPFAPNKTGTSILLTIYYPTTHPLRRRRPYLERAMAELYERHYNTTPGALSSITTPLQEDVPPLGRGPKHPYDTSKLSTVVFGPGFAGTPSKTSTSLLSDLASRGYTVVAMDHPYEQPFVQYPGPRYGGKNEAIYGVPTNYSSGTNTTFFLECQNFRVADTVATLDAFPNIVAKFYPHAAWNTSHFVLIGQSLGGSAALSAAQVETSPSSSTNKKKRTIVGALNFDGSIFGFPATNGTNPDGTFISDIRTPTLLWEVEGHNFDKTWTAFKLGQSRWWREIAIKGATHQDITDTIFWKQWFGVRVPSPGGQIEAGRMAALTRVYVAEYLDVLHGKKPAVGSRLDVRDEAWEEVRPVAAFGTEL